MAKVVASFALCALGYANTDESSLLQSLNLAARGENKKPADGFLDLGVGECVVNSRRPTNTNWEWSPPGECREACKNSPSCYGFSRSEQGRLDNSHCHLWEEDGLTGGGSAWSGEHCFVKEALRGTALKKATTTTTTTAREEKKNCADGFKDLGVGKCLVNGRRAPAQSYHYPWTPGGSAQGWCRDKCVDSAICYGYSTGGVACLLWEEGGLTGGGGDGKYHTWGAAHCCVKLIAPMTNKEAHLANKKANQQATTDRKVLARETKKADLEWNQKYKTARKVLARQTKKSTVEARLALKKANQEAETDLKVLARQIKNEGKTARRDLARQAKRANKEANLAHGKANRQAATDRKGLAQETKKAKWEGHREVRAYKKADWEAHLAYKRANQQATTDRKVLARDTKKANREGHQQDRSVNNVAARQAKKANGEAHRANKKANQQLKKANGEAHLANKEANQQATTDRKVLARQTKKAKGEADQKKTVARKVLARQTKKANQEAHLANKKANQEAETDRKVLAREAKKATREGNQEAETAHTSYGMAFPM